jgi:hypothetical protein
MKNKNKKIDLLPDEFSSEDKAGEFWDTHSITDFDESLEPVEFKADIKRRHFLIEVDEESFISLRDHARKQHKTPKQLAIEIIKQKIAS